MLRGPGIRKSIEIGALRERGNRRKSVFFPVLFLSEKGRIFPDSRFFFLCPCGAEGIKSCLSFRFLAPFSKGKRANFFLFLRKRKKYRNRRNGRPLRFLWNLRGPGVGGNIEKKRTFVCRRKSLAIFDGRRRVSSDLRVFFLCPCGAEGIKSCLSFRFTARRANLMNGFAGACLKFLFPLPRRGRGKKHANRKNGRPLRFQRNLRGPGIGGDARLPSKRKIEDFFIDPFHGSIKKSSFV